MLINYLKISSFVISKLENNIFKGLEQTKLKPDKELKIFSLSIK